MSVERRSEPRRAFYREVEVISDFTGRRFMAVAKDVSAAGMFLLCKEPFFPGDFVRVNFTLPDSTSFISLEAQVVRVSEDGAGLKFLDAPEWVVLEVRRFVSEGITRR